MCYSTRFKREYALEWASYTRKEINRTTIGFPFRVLFVALNSWLFMDELKKGKVGCAVPFGCYRFRSIRIITSPIKTIAIIAAAPMPKTYVSVIGAGVGVGAGVAAGASSTFMEVSAKDP
jgi:hypothetical protein